MGAPSYRKLNSKVQFNPRTAARFERAYTDIVEGISYGDHCPRVFLPPAQRRSGVQGFAALDNIKDT